jgi:SNF2 family DNA or RNA helicase
MKRMISGVVSSRTGRLDDELEHVLKKTIKSSNEYDSAAARKAVSHSERTRSLAKKGKKIVIWSTFIKTIESLASRLQDLGADYIHGGVDAGSEFDEDTRERKIRDFHLDDEKYVLIANPASCGEGISLHEVCHHAIYIDRNFNAGQYLQSEDRIHRLGLSKNQRTVIEILTSPATIDESVIEIGPRR